MQQFAITKKNAAIHVKTVIESKKRRETNLLVVVLLITFTVTPLLILGQCTIGMDMILGLVSVLALVLLIMRWPLIGLYIIAACALTVEINVLTINTPVFTDRLPVFSWPPSLAGQPERPIGYLFILAGLIFVCRRFIEHEQLLEVKPIKPFMFYMLSVALGILLGLATGGDIKMIMVELRPFWYFFLSYILASNLITHKRHLYAFFWIVIIAAGLKSLQGVYIAWFVPRTDILDPGAIMSHEESFFFVSLILFLILLFAHYRYRPQFYATLAVLPFDLIALVANERRTDYIALILGIIITLSIIFVVKPQIRKKLVISVLIITLLSTCYVVLFSRSNSPIAAPANAIMTVFQPNAGNEGEDSSNMYRVVENYDLVYTIKQNVIFGLGFGKPFYEPIPLTTIYPQIPEVNSTYNYIPHNTIYWVWMRLGLIGFFAFWYLIGSVICQGCLIVRQLQDHYLQLIGIYIIGIIPMEIVVAFGDYQLFTFRNVIYVGLLIGILMKLPHLDGKKSHASSRKQRIMA
jgi:hypothetical protein